MENLTQNMEMKSTISSDKPKYNIEWLVRFDKPLDDIFVSGTKIYDLKRKYQWMTDVDFFPYKPLTSKEIKDHNINIEYLGWYKIQDPQSNYYYASENCGYMNLTNKEQMALMEDMQQLMINLNGYIITVDILNLVLVDVDLTLHKKLERGILQEMKELDYVKSMRENFQKDTLKDCIDFMGITEKEAHQIIDSFRPKHLWQRKI